MDISNGITLKGGTVIIDKYRVPDAPIVTSAGLISYTSVQIVFTPPAFNGNMPITSYTMTNNVTSETQTLNQSTGGSFTFTGLNPNTVYSFSLYATNSVGNSANANSTVDTTPVTGQAYPSQTGTWTVPAGVFSISFVAVGGGVRGPLSGTNYGGAGGGLLWVNNVAVTPGTTVSVTFSGYTSTHGDNVTVSYGGKTGTAYGGSGTSGGTYSSTFTTYGGGNGGLAPEGAWSGSGGAGGYSGNGGQGGTQGSNGVSGSGGGGGGGYGAGQYGYSSGGGVGLYGEGTNGAGGTSSSSPGTPGSSGSGTSYGGGGSIQTSAGGAGLRIIYPGNTRLFPSTNTS